MAIFMVCNRCKGKGRRKTKIPFIKWKCRICNGTGRMRKRKK